MGLWCGVGWWDPWLCLLHTKQCREEMHEGCTRKVLPCGGLCLCCKTIHACSFQRLQKEGLTRCKYYWNFIQSSTRMPVERAFGMLKARFRILLKRCDMNLMHVPNMVVSCLTLHNICIVHGDAFDPLWVQEAKGSIEQELQMCTQHPQVQLKALWVS